MTVLETTTSRNPAHMTLLAQGQPGDGRTIMHAAAVAAHEPPSESPQCVTPTLTAWMTGWANSLDDQARQALGRYVPHLAVSWNSPPTETERQWIVADWLARILPATWLHAAGLTGDAERLAHSPAARAFDTLAALHEQAGSAARDLRVALGASWQAVSQARGESRDLASDEVWAAVADAVWAAGHSASRYLLTTAATAARIQPWWLLHRTYIPAAARDELGDPPPTPRGHQWHPIGDVAADAACVVAWRAIGQATPENAAMWARPDVDAWAVAARVASQALHFVTAAIGRTGHTVAADLLGLQRPT